MERRQRSTIKPTLGLALAVVSSGILSGCQMAGSIRKLFGPEKAAGVVYLDQTSVTLPEGGFGVVNVALREVRTTDTVVSAALTGPGAIADRFHSIPGTLTIPAGRLSIPVVIQSINDGVHQGNRTYQFLLSAGESDVTIQSGTLGIDLIDDEAPPVISIADAAANEGAGVLTFTVTMDKPADVAVTMQVTHVDQTAQDGVHFAMGAASLTVPAGSVSATYSVTTTDDSAPEINRTFLIELSSPSLGALAVAQARGTIVDDDNSTTVRFTQAAQTVGEASGLNQVAVELNAVAPEDVVVTVSLGGTAAGAGVDYTLSPAATLTIPQGQTTAAFDVSLVDDSLNEADETIVFTMLGPTFGSLGATTVHTLTITDNDPAPSLAIGDAAVNENGGTATATITLSAASGRPVTVDWTTANATASAPGDFAAGSATGLRFEPGQTSKTVVVAIVDDDVHEAAETFQVRLSNPVAATISDDTAVITINDDDPVPTISVTDLAVAESAGNAAVVISLSNPSYQNVVFDYATADGTALQPGDYAATSGTGATIAAGQVSLTVPVLIVNDALDEDDETFAFGLANIVNATAGANGVVTVTDNDPMPTVSVAGVDDTEHAREFPFTISLSTVSGRQVTVDWATAPGTALAPADYASASGTATIAPGESSAVAVVTVHDRPKSQGDRSFLVDLSAPVNATLATAQATGLIRENSPGAFVAVRDINQAPAAGALLRVGGKVFFTNETVEHGVELWVSDGTEVGTFMLKDINPGPKSSGLKMESMVEFDGKLYFTADDGVYGDELWASDGTAVGTVLVKDINAGSQGSQAQSFFVWNSKLFFKAMTTGEGAEPWVSDGTGVGTTLLKDIYPGFASSSPGGYQDGGGYLIFNATSMLESGEPWVTDGTTAGTVLLKDIWTGALSSYPAEFAKVGSKVVFSAQTISHGSELWATDGTTAGTAMVADIRNGANSSNPTKFHSLSPSLAIFRADGALRVTNGTTVTLLRSYGAGGGWVGNAISDGNGKAYMSWGDAADRELWVTDGTVVGTTLVKDILPGALGSKPALLGLVGGKLVFTADDGSNGTELWVSDGTGAGTTLLKDIHPGVGSSGIFNFTTDGAIAYFTAYDGVSGVELWKTDGTAAGTVLVKDLNPGAGHSSPGNLTILGPTLFFTGYDAATDLAKVGASDGSSLGTGYFASKTVASGGASIGLSVVEFNGKAYFSADDGSRGAQLWASDGTPAGTQMVKDLFPGGGCLATSPRAVAGTSLFFIGSSAETGEELFKTDGTTVGTELVKDITPGPLGTGLSGNFQTLGTKVFLSQVNTAAEGVEPWISDGTSAGTFILKDLLAGSNGSVPAILGSAGNFLYFAASNSGGERELGITDGTPAGTFVVDLNPSAGSNPMSGLALGTKFLFLANGGPTVGFEPWVSDGTPGGTILLKDIAPGGGGSSATLLGVLGGKAVFSASDSASGIELWVTDGTPANTVPVVDLYLGAQSGFQSLLGSVGGYIYFAGRNSAVGTELFRTDGTAAGTELVADLTPGAGNSSFGNSNFVKVSGSRLLFTKGDQLHATDGTEAGTVMIHPPGTTLVSPNLLLFNDVVYFSASSALYGTEWYRSDGTSRGTYMIDDFTPGALSSSLAPLLYVNGKLLFKGQQPLKGEELLVFTP